MSTGQILRQQVSKADYGIPCFELNFELNKTELMWTEKTVLNEEFRTKYWRKAQWMCSAFRTVILYWEDKKSMRVIQFSHIKNKTPVNVFCIRNCCIILREQKSMRVIQFCPFVLKLILLCTISSCELRTLSVKFWIKFCSM